MRVRLQNFYKIFYVIAILIPTTICQNLDNVQQIIRHSRSRNRLMRSNRHGEINAKDINFNNLTELTFDEQIGLMFVTNSALYDDDSAELNRNTRKNKTLKNESKSLLVLNKNSSRYPDFLSWNINKNETKQLIINKKNTTRKVTVDVISGSTLNTSSQASEPTNIKEQTTNASSHEDDVEELQLQDNYLVENVEEQVEFSSEESVTDIVRSGHVDIVTRFLKIVESQHLLGENCTAGTDLNLGEGVVDRYAQERFRVEADVAVNRANMLTRIWKYADPAVVMSEYFLHASVFSMVEFDNDIFAAGNCYDQYQYKDYSLFCPYAYRLPEGPILVKDLAIEYNYLSNTSEWFYIARKNAEKVIKNFNQFSKGVFCVIKMILTTKNVKNNDGKEL
ncbi:hypothetical protein FQA39_LY15560 [Lamprigera yunnana]|nr:hypothetical protein FQA39_LY15560 [Lamprigera yunnana]